MKLARPDVFHPRIVLAGSPQHPGGDADDAGLVTALRSRGLHAQWLSWDDPQVAGAHLVILRRVHDYAVRLEEFLAWAGGVPNLLNAAAVVVWNANRQYLADLAERAVPVVPGRIWAPGDPGRLPRDGHVFVGPVVGTGTRRFSDCAVAASYIDRQRRPVFVQSASGPETVLVFIGGKPSHAFITRDGSLHQGEADFEQWDVGAAALAASGNPSELLYARVHLVDDRVLEAQLIDPLLGWLHLDPATRGLAQREFALAVESACERLGLGPLSHRRP